LRPLLPVIINPALGGKKIQLMAMIDTGADECALPAAFAAILGHTLDQGSSKEVGTAGGRTTAWSHTANIFIEGLGGHDATVDFIPGLEIPILGVNSFLSNYILTIDYPRKMFSLEY